MNREVKFLRKLKKNCGGGGSVRGGGGRFRSGGGSGWM